MNSMTYSASALMVSMAMCGSPSTPPTFESIHIGSFSALNGYSDLQGRAQMMRTIEDTTVVQLHLEGLEPELSYPAHIHNQPCIFGNGGGHYKIDPAVEVAVADNEIWPRVFTNADGIGRADIEVAHVARGDALSVVVHDPNDGNAKMACADLVTPAPSGWTAAGIFAAFSAATELDAAIAGRADMTVDATGTYLELSLRGLNSESTYVSHVHELPCAVNSAGGHYKMNPTVEGVVAFNEIWPTVVPSSTGRAQDDVETSHVIRADAQSVVIHRVEDNGSKPKVACADLTRRSYSDVTTAGDAALLAEAFERGYGELGATATMTRDLKGETSVELSVSGLIPNQRYMVHVHDYSCSTSNGGGHYKIDPNVDGAVETNEIWLNLMSSPSGTGSASRVVSHLARPEAQSIVIHDYTDKARLACIDLN